MFHKDQNLIYVEVVLERIIVTDELSIYDLDGKWNDYIGVQKEIISVLKAKGYFNIKEVRNDETGMLIRITTRGIKETIGSGKRFQILPKVVKGHKIATLRVIPELIKTAKLVEDEVENYHPESEDKFAYFINEIVIDGELHIVRIVVKKKYSSNHFYIHHVDTEKSSELLSPSQETVNYEIQNS